MPNLDVQDAIKKARSYVVDLFNGEPITDIGLEEVEHAYDSWKITIGFNRLMKTPINSVLAMMTPAAGQRSYKVVTISDQDGELVSIKNREVSN